MEKIKRMELLAPAGDMQSARAAFSAGADACYIGGSFSARAYAANFAKEEMLALIEYAHLRGKRVHAAINIMLKQSEVPRALEEAAFLYEAGVDAIIASDLGFIAQAHRLFPGLPIHASTQMGVQDAAGARPVSYTHLHDAGHPLPGQQYRLLDSGCAVRIYHQ